MRKPSKHGYVYRIRNIVDGMAYIGGTTRHFSYRRSAHRYNLRNGKHPNRHLQEAWDRQGPDAFVFEIMETLPPDKALVLERERWYLANVPGLYNICPSAKLIGHKVTLETRAKISAAARGRTCSAETREKITAARAKQQPLSAESRLRISSALKGRPRSVEVRERISAAQRGIPKSAETRARMSAAARNRRR